MDKIQAFVSEQLKKEVPAFEVGDVIRVHNKIKEGTRERIQLFEGTVIAKHGGGISETFTVRRISYGVGLEKTFPLHSPNVEKVDLSVLTNLITQIVKLGTTNLTTTDNLNVCNVG